MPGGLLWGSFFGTNILIFCLLNSAALIKLWHLLLMRPLSAFHPPEAHLLPHFVTTDLTQSLQDQWLWRPQCCVYTGQNLIHDFMVYVCFNPVSSNKRTLRYSRFPLPREHVEHGLGERTKERVLFPLPLSVCFVKTSDIGIFPKLGNTGWGRK